MRAVISFSSDISLEGKDLIEIMRKFENIQLYDKDSVEKYGLSFVEVVSIEDEDSGAEIN